MFGLSRVERELALVTNRLDRMEECCEKNSKEIDEHREKRYTIENELSNLRKDIREFLEIFKEHDKKEMEKYQSINKELTIFRRIIWIGIGIGVTINIAYWGLNFIKIVKGL